MWQILTSTWQRTMPIPCLGIMVSCRQRWKSLFTADLLNKNNLAVLAKEASPDWSTFSGAGQKAGDVMLSRVVYSINVCKAARMTGSKLFGQTHERSEVRKAG